MIKTEKQSLQMINGFPFIPYETMRISPEDTLKRSREHYNRSNRRRSVRVFSDEPVPREVIENIILTAGTAPSGANKQPWMFCAISDPEIKKLIREEAEKEEYENYTFRMSENWLRDLKALATDWHKPFLETAPWLIAVFRKPYYEDEEARKRNNYYVMESVGIACGFLLSAIHHAGLVALTHTPSPMNFLTRILDRPENEKPFLLIPVGYPAEDTLVPDIKRKNLEEISKFY